MSKNLRTAPVIVGISTVLGGLFFTYLTYSETGSLPDYPGAAFRMLISILAANLTGTAIYGSIRWLNHWLPWQQSITLRLITGLFANCLLALLIPFACFLLYAYTQISFTSLPALLASHSDLALKWIILTLFAGFGFTLIHFTLFSYHQYAVQQIEAVQLSRTQLALQMEQLKSQLSPHYLFNCLNTISSLAYRDAHHAGEFIRKMAHTYQYLLATNDRSLVSLAEELDFVRAYTFLLKVRFNDAVDVTENIPAHLMDRKVPPLTIQMLLENAVKHSTVSAQSPLQVSISADEQNYLRVSNLKQPKQAPVPEQSLKVGLENIRKRYHFFTRKEIQIIQDEHFTVKLPLIDA